jgi:hypothetical protein
LSAGRAFALSSLDYGSYRSTETHGGERHPR